MPGIEDLFRNPGGGSDPGTYPSQEFYQPDDGRGRAVPQNWGDIIGGMLGQLGNVARARRNQEASNLLQAWEQAKTLGPEVTQQFLNNPQLPQWFKDKILGGITAQSMDPILREKAQKIYTEVQAALKQIYDQAAVIEYPEARDKFIEQKIAELKDVYPDWGGKLQTLPKGPDGHYVVPGVNTLEKQRTEARDARGEVDAYVAKAVTFPPDQRDAYLDRMRPEFERLYGKEAADRLWPTKDPKTGRYTLPGVKVNAADDIKSTTGSAGTTVQEYLVKNNPAALAQLQASLKGTAFDYILNAPLTTDSLWDVENHTLDISAMQQYVRDAAVQIERTKPGKAAKPDITALKLQFESLRAREMNLRTTIRDLSDPVRSATPEGKAQLAAAKNELAQVLQQENQVLQSIADANSPQTQGSAAPGAGPAGSGSSAPTTQTPAQQFQAALKTKPRADVLRALAASGWWKGLDQQARAKFVNEVGITKSELQWMARDGQGNPPANTPAAQPGARQEPVDPIVAAILKQMAPSGPSLGQIGSGILSALGRVGSELMRGLPPFDVQNPSVRHDVLLLLKVWPRLNAKQREQMRQARGLSEQQAQWLTQHAGQPVPTGRH